MYKFIIIIIMMFSNIVFAEGNIDQWQDSKKTYKDLIEEGFEIKSYDTNNIQLDGGLIILLFVTVLQKNNTVFECQEYQTMDSNMKTLDMSFVCRELIQPYKIGVDT